jgi:polyhydroxyalkanoic acid synthase PhaR subunit
MDTNNHLYGMWKDLYDKSSKLFDEKVKEDFPTQDVGKMLEMDLLFKKMLNETTERYFEQVNIPNRDDIFSMSSLIVNVDAKVDDLEELFEDTKANQVSKAEFTHEISNIKSDIKTLDQKLNSILTLLLSGKKQETVQKENKIQQIKKGQNTVQKTENTKKQ